MKSKHYGKFDVNSRVDFPRVSCIPFVVLSTVFLFFVAFVVWVAS